jgi:hypothetical protein
MRGYFETTALSVLGHLNFLKKSAYF